MKNTASPQLTDSPEPKISTIAELRQNTLLWYKIHVFIYDLQNSRSGSNPISSQRLEGLLSPDFLCLPYFTTAEAQLIRNASFVPIPQIWDTITIKEAIQLVFSYILAGRLDSRGKARGYSRSYVPQDLLRLFELAFGVSEKDLKRDQKFMELVKKRGLELKKGECWLGGGKWE